MTDHAIRCFHVVFIINKSRPVLNASGAHHGRRDEPLLNNCLHVYQSGCCDEAGTHHLIIGLNRENVETILRGDVLTLPAGYLEGLTHESNVVVLFAETDEELAKQFLPPPRPS